MISVATIDDKDGNPVIFHDDSPSSKRGWIDAHGLLGGTIAPLRQSKAIRPQVHGGVNRTRFQDGGQPSFTQEIVGDDIEDAYDELLVISAVLQDTLDYGPALLKWTEGETGRELQRYVKLDSTVDAPLTGFASLLTFPVALFAEDPRAYAQAAAWESSTTLSAASGGLTFPMTFPFTFSPSGGGTITVTNDGVKQTPPKFRIYGLIQNPSIVEVGGTGRIVLDNGGVTIPAGSYVEIDTWERTLTLPDGTNVRNFLNSAATTWFDLPPGETDLQLIGGGFDGVAHLDVLVRAAY